MLFQQNKQNKFEQKIPTQRIGGHTKKKQSSKSEKKPYQHEQTFIKSNLDDKWQYIQTQKYIINIETENFIHSTFKTLKMNEG